MAASSGSSGSSRCSPSNEKIALQFPESLRFQPQRKSRPSRPPLPPPQPSLTPSQKWTRGPGFWRSFIAICIPLLLSALEGSVTNTALPTISDALDLGTTFSWVATAFLLASTIFQPLYGQLADIWGRKYPMMLAILVFGAGSAMCGWAQSGAVLILGRIVQGLGTGGIDLFAELILSDLVPLRQRGTYMAIKHCVFAAGTTIGPLLGGVFAEHGWRWCFWVNLPVCALSVILMWFWLHVGGGIKTKDVKIVDELRKIDGIGTLILTTAVVLVLVALSTGGAYYSWDHPAIVVPFVLGLVFLLAFPFWERSKRCKYPIMPPPIFANRTSATAFALTLIHGFVTYGFQFFLPPFFQAVKSSSPTRSGIEVLPTTLVIVVMAALGGPLLSKFGKYKPIHHLGFACMTLGFGLCVTMTQSTPVGGWVMIQLILAFGCGIVVSTMLPAVQVELPDKANGSAAGSWAFLRGTGSLFGVAVPGAIFNIRFAQLLPSIRNAKARAQLANGQAYQRASAAFVSRFGEKVKDDIIGAFTESLKCVWIVFAVMAGVGFLLTFLERQVKMRRELNTAYGLKTPKGSGLNTPRSGIITPQWDEDPENIQLEESCT
ncbi:MFS general substrate transporter [Lophiostoma macrostomum CBS 122681]|uniref:MFS general substrate transporter n=1 Tax=Lophiostoma macrostomum CBS 122681 TaxID=1314788 RepID=A0A6A6SR82_9PLEO|nr:MFS general substrate transporter [Lophiostoma macrostomum CBS 122681]